MNSISNTISHDSSAVEYLGDAAPEEFRQVSFGGNTFDEIISVLKHKNLPNTYAMAVESRHLNKSTVTHGGVVASFADCALGFTAVEHTGCICLTVSLNIDYLNPSKQGDLLVATTKITKCGKRLLYCDGLVSSSGKSIARISAILSIGSPYQGSI